MKKLNNRNLKLGIQKNGRLTKDSLTLLQKAQLIFDDSNEKLYVSCSNLPVDLFFLRNGDIAQYVEAGIIDIGIVGQNLLYESDYKVNSILDLDFGYCNFSLAVPQTSDITNIKQLKNMRIATCYSNSAQKFFDRFDIPIKIISLKGSVEVAPALGLAEAIADIVSTGRTLAFNELRVLKKIYDSQAVLIANKEIAQDKVSILQDFLYQISSSLSVNQLIL